MIKVSSLPISTTSDGLTLYSIENGVSHKTLSGGANGIAYLGTTGRLTTPQMASFNFTTLSTGIMNGGIVSIGTVTTTFNITAGNGIVIDNYTDSNNPTYTLVNWTAFTGVTDLNLTAEHTYIGLNSAGSIIQQTTEFTRDQLRDIISIGRLVHGGGIITNVAHYQNYIRDTYSQLRDLAYSIGVINNGGNVYSANGVNLLLNKSAGESFRMGGNYPTSKKDPNVTTNTLLTGLTFRYRYQSGSGGFITSTATTLVNPGNYDDGSGTLRNLGNNKWSIQRIYFDPSIISDHTLIFYGPVKYNSSSKALSNLFSESFIKDPSLDGNYILRGWLILKGNTTDLTNTSKAIFVVADKFGIGTAGGYSSSTTDLQTAYNNSNINPEIILNSVNGGFSISDATTALGTSLFNITNNANTQSYFNVTAADVITTVPLSATSGTFSGNINITTTNLVNSLQITDVGSSGANIKLIGNGTTTPNKSIRSVNGQFQILNNAYSTSILTLTDSGSLTIPGSLTASNFSGSLSGTNTGDQNLSPYALLSGASFTGAISSSSNISSSGKFLAAEGSGVNGGYSFTLDGAQDTGMFSPSDGILDLYSNSVNIVKLTPSTANIYAPLTISGVLSASNFSGSLSGTNTGDQVIPISSVFGRTGAITANLDDISDSSTRFSAVTTNADNTISNSQAMIANPSFSAGTRGWNPAPTITTSGGVDGGAYASRTLPSGLATSGIANTINTLYIPVQPGDRVTIQGYVRTPSTSLGRHYIGLSVHGLSGYITSIDSPSIYGTDSAGSWVPVRLIRTMPSGATFIILFLALGNFSGTTLPVAETWDFDAITMAIFPRSLDDVPDSATKFAAIQAGADKTSLNTSADTTNVNGVASTAISPIASLMPAVVGATKNIIPSQVPTENLFPDPHASNTIFYSTGWTLDGSGGVTSPVLAANSGTSTWSFVGISGQKVLIYPAMEGQQVILYGVIKAITGTGVGQVGIWCRDDNGATVSGGWVVTHQRGNVVGDILTNTVNLPAGTTQIVPYLTGNGGASGGSVTISDYYVKIGSQTIPNSISGISANILPNWNFSVSDTLGKPAGLKAVEGVGNSTDIQFGGIGIQIIGVTANNDAYGFPAIPIDDHQVYEVSITHRSSVASTAGLDLRFNELNAALPSGYTHIGRGGDPAFTTGRTSIVDINGGSHPFPGTTTITQTYTYTPTVGTKFASFSMYRWYPSTPGLVYEVANVQMSLVAKTFSNITSKPTTLSGYGITDPIALTTGATFSGNINITTTNLVNSLQITDVGSSGANIKLIGNGTTTPNKSIRSINGQFQILNNAYNLAILKLTDSGSLTIPGSLTASNFSGSLSGTNTGDQNLSPYALLSGASFTGTLAVTAYKSPNLNNGDVVSYAPMQGGRTYLGYDFNSYLQLYESRFVNTSISTNIPPGLIGNAYWFGMGAGDTASRGFDLVGTSGAQLFFRERTSGIWERTITFDNGTTNLTIPGSLSASRIFSGYDSTVTDSISCSNWFRSSGATGWYNQTHYIGINATDSTYIRAYPSGKSFAATDFVITSDKKLKENIKNLKDRGRLCPRSFTWKKNGPNPGEYDIGFIAQEVEQLYPELVGEVTEEDGSKTKQLSYSRLTAILANQLNNTMDETLLLKTQVKHLMQRLKKLENK